MPRPPAKTPTDRELDILRVLWKTTSASLSEIRESLCEDREVAATSVATMLKVMAEKGLVKRTRDRRWRAAVSRSQARRRLTTRLLDRAFDGSALKLMAHVVESHPLTKQQISELRELLDDYRSSNP